MFAWLVLRAYYLSGRLTNATKNKIYLFVGIATILFGVSIEGMQQFIPDRGADVYDIIANTFGIVFAQVLFYLVHKKKLI